MKTMRPVFANLNLKIDQKRKNVLNNPLFLLKTCAFRSLNDHNLSTEKLDRFPWNRVGSQSDLS